MALLVVGIPVALVSGVLQNKVSQQDPKFHARYELDSYSDYDAVILPVGTERAALPRATDCASQRRWAHTHGGIDFVTSRIEIEATGAKDRTVAIKNIRAVKVGQPKKPRPSGTVLLCQTEGSAAKIDIGIKMDTSPSLPLKGTEEGMISRQPFFGRTYIYLEPQKPEIFNLTTTALAGGYDYVIRIDGTVDGESHTWTLRDNGKPFHISGRALVGWYATYFPAPGDDRIKYTRVQAYANGFTGPEPTRQMDRLGWNPSAALGTPIGRATSYVPDMTADGHDPLDVAMAWASLAHTYDTRYDTTPADAKQRAQRFVAHGSLGRMAALREPESGKWWPLWSERQAWTIAWLDTEKEPRIATGGRSAHVELDLLVSSLSHRGAVPGNGGPYTRISVTLSRDGSAEWRVSGAVYLPM
ncbi:hypothetical protein [Streptomyces longispororuber]|uniref:hypothetical protein n=1 Tax=Streptomyces longispororuber TaxID=68230 RepID=UPI002109AC0C|nr:hypothetical protein [Streptomyces longispororuber]MCQ4213228.1 hypothetical protein [Streptomyces longispororuber]